jgi:ABC-type transport system substrate-binding protein
MNFCPQCGTKVEANWTNCPNCRYYLPERTVPSRSHAPQRSQEEKVENYSRREEIQEKTRFDHKNDTSKLKIIIAVLLIMLIFSMTGNIIMSLYNHYDPGPPGPSPLTLYVGTSRSLVTLDPIDAWDTTSYDVINQVVETLFWYDVRDPSLPFEPLLGKNYSWNSNNIVLSLDLKRDIFFHDGFPFNSTAVKWNIDRWLYLTNATGLLSAYAHLASPSSLFYRSNGTAIIKNCIIVDEYSVNITLNEPFGPFLSFLSAPFCSIISPYSHSQTEYTELVEGDLIGTGPFQFDSYIEDIEVKFSRWDRYWRTGSFYEELIFSIINDKATRIQALLVGEIDFAQNICPIEACPQIKIEETGTTLAYYYMGFNNKLINRTLREALSFAYNYSHVIDVIMLGNAERGCPAVPSGMPGHNASVQSNLPYINITRARMLMQQMGYGVGWDVDYPGLDESYWNNASFATEIFGAPLNLIRIGGGSISINMKLNELALKNWQLIGIDATDLDLGYSDWLEDLLNKSDYIHVWHCGWAPGDYFDAYNILDPLFNPQSSWNFGQVDIPLVNELLHNASIETDISERIDIYQRIQYILFQKEFVHMPLWASYHYTVHASYLKNVPYTPTDMYGFYAWPIYD